MAPTPSPRSIPCHQTPSKTPQSKQRLHFSNPRGGGANPSPNPVSAAKETVPTEHPVEVITRIRDYPDLKESPSSVLEIPHDRHSVRVRTDHGNYRDFSLDGVSVSRDEDLEAFYERFVESRIEGVRLGSKCTIMMYGPTGSGKSHTMFGCSTQPGIVYRALRHILGDGDEGNGAEDALLQLRNFVQVTVLEIYNEEIYDLLSGNLSAGGASIAPPKGTPKVRLEVMGKKAKNATYISGNEAGKISRELAKLEKRRIVKSTLCNERSSRSHCLIILDVPTVGGRLMLVDMAGSENIEQAGQSGFEAKMQTAKINQGNVALKRVVESIANGDSHVPFRDSKLTMLLQDAFEDDKSKILMILCASPDPKEMHKTISTLEYGAKAKCIVRAAHMPTPKDKMNSDVSSTLLRSRIVAMNQFISKLQMDNRLKEKELDGTRQKLLQREEEVVELRSKLKLIEGTGSTVREEEISLKVDERTQVLRLELTKREETTLRQQEELLMLRKRLAENESERGKAVEDALQEDINGGRFMKRLSEIYAGDQRMEKSMELDLGDQQSLNDVIDIKDHHRYENNYFGSSLNPHLSDMGDDGSDIMPRFPDKVCLSTVFEGDDEGQERESISEEEVDKEVVEENITHLSRRADGVDSFPDSENFVNAPNYHRRDEDTMERLVKENAKDDDASIRRTRIQNIFTLCGNHRELSQQVRIPTSSKKPDAANTRSSPLALGKESSAQLESAFQMEPRSNSSSIISDSKAFGSPVSGLLSQFASLHLMDEVRSTEQESFKDSSYEILHESKENRRPGDLEGHGLVEVYVKWEASKVSSGNLIKKLKFSRDSTLSDLRKQIETQLEDDNSKQPFTFLLLGDPSGAPVVREKEATVRVSKLPICSNRLSGHLACLRPIKKMMQKPYHIPFSSLENRLPRCTKFSAF